MNRRKFLAAIPAAFLSARGLRAGTKLPFTQSKYTVDEKINSFQDVSTYNNYYEFGTDKDEPSQYAKNFKTAPWTVSIEGDLRQAAQVQHRRDPDTGAARGTHLPASLRGSLVDRGALDRLFAEHAAEAGGAHL